MKLTAKMRLSWESIKDIVLAPIRAFDEHWDELQSGSERPSARDSSTFQPSHNAESSTKNK